MANKDLAIHITAEELYGQIRATQEAFVELASFIGMSNQLRNRILHMDVSVWKNGLISTEDESTMITRDDLPSFFQGMRDANEYMVNLINARTSSSNQLGFELPSSQEDPEIVNTYQP